MKAVYVDGMRFRSVKDAALFLDGQVNGLRKAIDCGLPYRGATVSHDPPVPENPPEHWPGATSLLRNPKVCP
jgi:hypothetical protein